MIDDHDRCEWVNVSSGTGSPTPPGTCYGATYMRATTTSDNDLFGVHSETLWNFIMGLMVRNNYVRQQVSG